MLLVFFDSLFHPPCYSLSCLFTPLNWNPPHWLTLPLDFFLPCSLFSLLPSSFLVINLPPPHLHIRLFCRKRILCVFPPRLLFFPFSFLGWTPLRFPLFFFPTENPFAPHQNSVASFRMKFPFFFVSQFRGAFFPGGLLIFLALLLTSDLSQRDFFFFVSRCFRANWVLARSTLFFSCAKFMGSFFVCRRTPSFGPVVFQFSFQVACFN